MTLDWGTGIKDVPNFLFGKRAPPERAPLCEHDWRVERPNRYQDDIPGDLAWSAPQHLWIMPPPRGLKRYYRDLVCSKCHVVQQQEAEINEVEDWPKA